MSPFFIIGAPRSGTTMLQMALNRHSQVVIPPETAFFTLLARSARGQAYHWRRIEKDFGIPRPTAVPTMSPGPQAADVFGQLLADYAASIGKPDAMLFGEKSPEHQRRVTSIRKTYPDAKFVLIYRDGRDVALSLTKVPWMPGDLFVGFELWRYYFRLQLALMPELGNRLHVVRYESLVQNPQFELASVQAFLGLRVERQVASGSGNEAGIPNFEVSYKRMAKEAITTASVGRWKKELSARQLRILESRGKSELLALDYELSCRDARATPFLYYPATLLKVARWLGSRCVYQWIDQFVGTAFNPQNRTLREVRSTSESQENHD